jgi:hypothetical protein
MRYKRESWTLVRYAGPASKASIGSKPIGSELVRYVGIYLLQVNKKLTPEMSLADGTRWQTGRPG